MVRYERTGEYRMPQKGEHFEDGAPQLAMADYCQGRYWILRLVEAPEPAREADDAEPIRVGPVLSCCDGYRHFPDCPKFKPAAPANMKPERPGTEEVVKEVRGAFEDCGAPESPLMREAIRRVRAHEEVREYLEKQEPDGLDDIAASTLAERILALLDAPGETEKA